MTRNKNLIRNLKKYDKELRKCLRNVEKYDEE